MLGVSHEVVVARLETAEGVRQILSEMCNIADAAKPRSVWQPDREIRELRWMKNSMSFADESPHVGQVFEDVVAFHASNTIVSKWPRLAGVEDDADVRSWVEVTV